MTQTTTPIYSPMPLRYLWPMTIVVLLVIALWSQFPWRLHLIPEQGATLTQQALPTVAYVTIDAASINPLVKRAASEWMLGSGSSAKRRFGLDLTTLEASLKPPAPLYLEKGSIIPSSWLAGEVTPIPLTSPLIPVPGKRGPQRGVASPVPLRDTLNIRLSASLKAAKFIVPFFENTLKNTSSASGQCRFYIECDASGAVAHVLRLSPTTQDVSVFERALMLGKAEGRASGWIDIEWMILK